MSNRKKQASFLRLVRRIHRYTGVALFLLFIIMSLSGLLLGWKKDSGGFLLPNTQIGSTTNLSEWKSLKEIEEIAIKEVNDLSNKIKKLDVRPSKGIVKVLFEKGNISVQIDGNTGEVLQVARRRSDWLENLHDGSIVDDYIDIKWLNFKLIYTTVMATALLIFCITGFWLWYGPKQMRSSAQK